MITARFLVATLLGAAALSAQATAFQNGSFESLAFADGQQRLIDDTSPTRSLSGWEASGMIFARDSLGSDARLATDGDNLVFMNNGATLAQSFDTHAGETYHVSFDYSKNRGTAAVFVDGHRVEKIGGGVVGDMTPGAGFDFTATGSQTTLSFMAQMAQANGGQGRLWLDDVRVTAAVPEPATAALSLCGLVLLGGLARRRRH